MLHELRLGVWVFAVSPTCVRDYGGVELLAKVPAQLCQSPLGILRDLLGRDTILDRVHRFAGVILEITQLGFKLLLQFPDLFLLLTFPLGSETCPLARQFFFLSAKPRSFRLCFAKVRMQTVEELSNVAGLSAQA